jgi:hypothetical protein
MNTLPKEIHYKIMEYLDIYSIQTFSKILCLPIPKQHTLFWKNNYETKVQALRMTSYVELRWSRIEYLPNLYYQRVNNFDKYGCMIYENENETGNALRFAHTIFSKTQEKLYSHFLFNGPFYMIFILSPDKTQTVACNVMMFETLNSMFARLLKQYPGWFDFDHNTYILNRSHHNIYFESDMGKSLYSLSIEHNATYEIGKITR